MAIENLVAVSGNIILCDSQVVADKFEKKHAYIVRLVQKLISDFGKIKGDSKSPLIREKEGEYRGKKYIYYEMDKKFFAHLAMRFRGEKAFEWQCKFIDAFFHMEQQLLEQRVQQKNIEWQREREQGKEIRLDLTDIIQTFIQYSRDQGASEKGANMYYSNITQMEYKALGLIEKNEKVNKGLRNTLDIMDLYSLLSAERVARKALSDGMKQELHYKDIFQIAKKDVMQLADIMVIKPRIKWNENIEKSVIIAQGDIAS